MNHCDYEVRVIGTRKAGMLVYASFPAGEYKEITKQESLGDGELLCFEGSGALQPDDAMDTVREDVDLEALTEEDIPEKGKEYADCSLQEKSRAFHCDILVHRISEMENTDCFVYYSKGEEVKRREYAFEDSAVFDWNTLEYIDFESDDDIDATISEIENQIKELSAREETAKLPVIEEPPAEETIPIVETEEEPVTESEETEEAVEEYTAKNSEAFAREFTELLQDLSQEGTKNFEDLFRRIDALTKDTVVSDDAPTEILEALEDTVVLETVEEVPQTAEPVKKKKHWIRIVLLCIVLGVIAYLYCL